MFDIYSNDINFLCENKENLLFADDTCLTYTGNDLTSLVTYVNTRLKIILDWCCSNKLSLNPNKSEFMLLTNRPIDNDPIITLGACNISRSNNVKYLGLFIDDKLNFSNHIINLKKKLSRLAGASYRLRGYFNYRASKNFYYACVYSLITYCLAVYGGALNTYRGSMLTAAHEKIIKNLFSKYCPNSCPFKRNKLLKLKDIYKLYVGIHMYKMVNLNINEEISETLSLETPDHHYNTRNRNNLRTPFPRVEAIRRNYQYQFVSVWNGIPNEIKESASLKIFKRNLTKYFCTSY